MKPNQALNNISVTIFTEEKVQHQNKGKVKTKNNKPLCVSLLCFAAVINKVKNKLKGKTKMVVRLCMSYYLTST